MCYQMAKFKNFFARNFNVDRRICMTDLKKYNLGYLFAFKVAIDSILMSLFNAVFYRARLF